MTFIAKPHPKFFLKQEGATIFAYGNVIKHKRESKDKKEVKSGWQTSRYWEREIMMNEWMSFDMPRFPRHAMAKGNIII